MTVWILAVQACITSTKKHEIKGTSMLLLHCSTTLVSDMCCTCTFIHHEQENNDSLLIFTHKVHALRVSYANHPTL